MTLVVGYDFTHVRNVVLFVLVWVLLGVLLEDLDDFAATGTDEREKRKKHIVTLPFVADGLS